MTIAQARLYFRALVNQPNTTVLPDAVSGSTQLAVDAFIQAACEESNRIVPWHFTTATSGITLINGTQEYTVPAGLIDFVWLEHNAVRLDRSTMDEWHRRGIDWRDTAAGTPTEYALYGNQVIFYPKPNAAAVTADSTPDFRHHSTPDFATDGMPQLADNHHRAVLWFAAGLFLDCFPALNGQSPQSFYDRFYRAMESMAGIYRQRALVP